MNAPQFPFIDLPQLASVVPPPVQHVRLSHPQGTPVADVPQAVCLALNASQRLTSLPRGAQVAVAVGSRGIAHMTEVVATAVAWLNERGYQPFLVPAMGSHGGALAEDQAQILRHLGLGEEAVGAPIRATMEIVDYGKTEQGISCKFDRNAAQADAVLAINRVKSHTSFARPIESGLTKLVAVGLGKAEGARNVHKIGPRGLAEVLPKLAQIAIAQSPLAYGIALVENARKDLIVVEGVEPEQFLRSDERLLTLAKAHLARLPFTQIDALIVEEIGKEISGMGMDYAVTGRTDIRGFPNPSEPFIHKIGILALTPESMGNAQGIGVADFIPHAMTRDLDLRAMYMNALTAGVIEKVRIPPVLPTERAVVQACLATCWRLNEEQARFCIIRSTLHLQDILASPALVEELKLREDIEILSEPGFLKFSSDGRLLTRCSRFFS